METLITIVTIVFLIFMIYSMIKYAKFIHHYPRQTEEEAKSVEDNTPAEINGDGSSKD